MKNLKILTLLLIGISVGLTGCKKEEKFDIAPVNTYQYSMVFTPQYPSTLTTNYNANNPTGLVFKGGGDQYNNYIYEISGRLFRKYVNSRTNLNDEIDYVFAFQFSSGSSLTSGTYTKTATPTVTTGGLTTKDAFGKDYGWGGYSSKVNAIFDSYPDCYQKINITNVYTRKLPDGLHTYIDGTIDATMLGITSTNLDGNPIIPTILESQLHLQLNFSGAELIK